MHNASHTELQIYIYKEIIPTVAGSGGLVLRSITQGHPSFTWSAMNLGRVLIRKEITGTIKNFSDKALGRKTILLPYRTGGRGG